MSEHQRWVYMGNFNRVTPCEYHYGSIDPQNHPECMDGSCPGLVDGACAFFGIGTIVKPFQPLFVPYSECFPVTYRPPKLMTLTDEELFKMALLEALDVYEDCARDEDDEEPPEYTDAQIKARFDHLRARVNAAYDSTGWIIP